MIQVKPWYFTVTKLRLFVTYNFDCLIKGKLDRPVASKHSTIRSFLNTKGEKNYQKAYLKFLTSEPIFSMIPLASNPRISEAPLGGA